MYQMLLEIEKANRRCVGAGLQDAAQALRPKPDAHRVMARIVEIGVGGKHRPDGHIETGLLPELAPGGSADILIPLDMAAGNAPLSPIRPGALHQQQPVVFNQHHRHPGGRIAEMNPITAAAVAPGDAFDRSVR